MDIGLIVFLIVAAAVICFFVFKAIVGLFILLGIMAAFGENDIDRMNRVLSEMSEEDDND